MNGLDVIVTSHNTRELLAACLESLRRYPPARPMRVTVTDNASTDGSVELVRERFPEVELLTSDTNRGFGAATNRALRRLQHEAALLLNADAEVTAGCLDLLLEHLDRHPYVGIVGPRQTGGNGQTQLTCGRRPTLAGEITRAWRHRQLRAAADNGSAQPSPTSAHDETILPVAWVSGSALLVRREALPRAGLFDENFFLYFEDIDFCLRVSRAGFAVHYLPGAVVVHRGGASAALCPDEAEYEYRRSQLRFWAKHGGTPDRLLVRGYVAGRGLWVLAACRLGLIGPRAIDRAAVQRRVLRLAWKGVA